MIMGRSSMQSAVSGEAGAERPALDEDHLDELFQDADLELFEILQQSAEEDAAQHFATLHANPNAPAAAAAAHALKGTAASLGFDRAADCAERIMLAADGGQVPDAQEVARLKHAWDAGLTAFCAFAARFAAG